MKVIPKKIVACVPDKPRELTTLFDKKIWPYSTDVMLKKLDINELSEIKKWCRINFNKDEYTSFAQFFAFKTETAYAWFLLRWT